jgi:hypothetical protein
MTMSVRSEVGQLRQAIVHRPGLELARLTPENIGGLLFDDVMWASKRASRLVLAHIILLGSVPTIADRSGAVYLAGAQSPYRLAGMTQVAPVSRQDGRWPG